MNRLSRSILANAAQAMAGMLSLKRQPLAKDARLALGLAHVRSNDALRTTYQRPVAAAVLAQTVRRALQA